MLRKQEKNAFLRLIFLALGWGIGLDRFYEGDKKGGILSILGWGAVFTSFLFLHCYGVEYFDGIKTQWTLEHPRASLAITAVSAESIPPLKPITASLW